MVGRFFFMTYSRGILITFLIENSAIMRLFVFFTCAKCLQSFVSVCNGNTASVSMFFEPFSVKRWMSVKIPVCWSSSSGSNNKSLKPFSPCSGAQFDLHLIFVCRPASTGEPAFSLVEFLRLVWQKKIKPKKLLPLNILCWFFYPQWTSHCKSMEIWVQKH